MTRFILLLMVALLAAARPLPAADEPPPRARATGPAGFVLFGRTLEGGVFVPKALADEYARLQSSLDQTERELDAGKITGKEAIARAKALRASLKAARDKLDVAKVRIAAARVHRSEETLAFDPCPERLLVVTADRVTIVGTDEAKVRVVLEKTVLGAGDAPVGGDLAAVKLVHRVAPDPEVVGKPRAEIDADEARYARDNPNATPEALKFRREIADANREHFRPYEPFQGKAFDHVSVDGLTHAGGNRQLGLDVFGADGSGSSGSVWRRHAAVTVYVPKCRVVAVRGSRRGLDVRDVRGSVVVTSHGERDRDYDAAFRVKGVDGSVTVVDFPVGAVEDVRGDVTIRALADFANSGTLHANDERVFRFHKPNDCLIRNVGGRVDAHFGRVNLKLEALRGGCAARNDFGDTTYTVSGPLGDVAHRIESTAGTVTVAADPGHLAGVPVVLGTNYGTIRTNAPREGFSETSLGAVGDARAWHCVRSAGGEPADRAADPLALQDLLTGKTAAKTGLTVVTRAGGIDLRVAGK